MQSKTRFRWPMAWAVVRAAIVSAGLCLALPGIASAQPPGAPGMGPQSCLPPAIRALVPKYDSNQNGTLERSELRALRRDKRQAAFARHDRDGDGKLSDKEREALHHDKMVEDFESLDANRDAAISKSEAQGSCTPIERHFDRVDGNGDGAISWIEFAAAARQHRSLHRHPDHRRGAL